MPNERNYMAIVLIAKINNRKKGQVRVEVNCGEKSRVVYGSAKNIGRIVGGIATHYFVESKKEQRETII